MIQKNPDESIDLIFFDEMFTRAKVAQPEILKETLKAGIPITYRNEEGILVQKNPDGSIHPYQQNEQYNAK
jgi:hypothetical protein